MSNTSSVAGQAAFRRGLRRPLTAVPCLMPAVRHVARDFGWFWEITENVDFLTTELSRKGHVVYVWDTPQFEAVEWLVGRGRLQFPAEFDQGLHGTFCRILGLEAVCRAPLLPGDILDSGAIVEKAQAKVESMADDLGGIRPEIWAWLRQLPPTVPIDVDELEKALRTAALSLGAMSGVMKAELKLRSEVMEAFTGRTPAKGRPANWVARYVAMAAADIYRTAYAGEIQQSEDSNRPSFLSFLKRFGASYPEVESADQRALARHVWRGAYTGQPFAPI